MGTEQKVSGKLSNAAFTNKRSSHIRADTQSPREEKRSSMDGQDTAGPRERGEWYEWRRRL